MTQKRAPSIFLGILVIILFFILGFRSGQEVEKTDKKIAVLLSTAPTATAAPTAMPLSFATVAPTGCGISLLYPGSLTLSQQGTQSAQFTDRGKTVLTISCAVWAKPQPTSIPAAPAGIIGGRPLSVTSEQESVISFLVKHPTKNILISIEAEKALYPYLLQNLNFVK